MALLSAICGAGFTVAVCLALGSLLSRALRLDFYRFEAALFAFVNGSACLSLAVFFLCVVHQARPGIFLAGGSAAIAAAIWKGKGSLRRKSLPAMPRFWTALFVAVFGAFFLCYLINAAAPEISPDGSGYHLGNVARDLSHHGFDWQYHSIYSSLGQGMEMLFLVAFAIGRHPAAALVHMSFQAALPLFMVSYGRRFGFPRAGTCAALLLYASPIVGITGISAYNDLMVATLIFAGFYLLQVNNHLNNCTIMICCGLLFGEAYAVKYTAGISLLFSAALSRGKKALALLAGAAVMAGPWVVRNWIWLGNPFAPFLNSWFPNAYWTAGAEQQYLAGLREYPRFKSYWEFISQVTINGGLVPGMLGPAFLLLPLALLAWRYPHGRKLLLAGAIYSIPAILNSDLRFAIPALPFFALALGLAMENSAGILPAVTLFQAVLCWPTVMDAYCDPNAWRIRDLPIHAALRIEPEAAFIGSHVGDYAFREAIDRAVPPGGRIFSFAGRASAYLDRDIIVGYESTQGMRIQEALQAAAARNSGRRAAALEAKGAGCGFLLVNESDSVAADMKNNLNSWGLSAISKANGTTLYRID